MKKSNKKGFTLVELIVVIAIIGVLAAILVPQMMNYVKNSRLKTANANAKTAYDAIVTCQTDLETKGQGAKAKLTDAANVGEVDCTGSIPGTGELKIAAYKSLSDNGADAGILTFGATTINGQSGKLFVTWYKTSGDTTVGQYPDACEEVEKLGSMVYGSFIARANQTTGA